LRLLWGYHIFLYPENHIEAKVTYKQISEIILVVCQKVEYKFLNFIFDRR